MDLDQSGNPEQTTKVYLGPSLGWVQTQVKSSITITSGGTYNLPSGSSVVLVNSTTSVTINLPDVKSWINEPAYQPATGFERAIVIKDLGGNAVGAPILVVPFGGQAIDNTIGNFIINRAHQVLYLMPLKDLSGWYANSQILVAGGSGGGGIPGGVNQSIQFNNSGSFAGFVMGGDATTNVGTGILTIANLAVTYSKMQNVSATSRFLGRISTGAGVIEELSGAQATTLLNPFTTSLQGLAPASGGGSANFLRADGIWATPAGSGGITVGTTSIASGISGNYAFNSAGIFGEKTPTQLTADVAVFTSSLSGAVPASGGGAVNFLRADGAWTTPPGGGGFTPAPLTRTNDTNVTLTLGGTPTAALLQATSITMGWIGLLDSSRGGTANGFFAVTGPASSAKTFTFPNSSQAVAMLDLADQTVSGGANVTAASLATGSITVDCGKCPLQKITNNGAFTITAPVNDGSCLLLVTNSASAGAITFTGFSVGSNTGDALTTTNGSRFTISIWRINAISGYRIAAHQ